MSDTGRESQTPTPPDGVEIRPATARDHLGVVRVLDAANLECSAATVERRIDTETVVVADDDDRIVGALVAVPRDDGVTGSEATGDSSNGRCEFDGAHVDAVAVRRRRRDRGIGAALVDYAAGEWTQLTAEFDPGVKPFYDALGFDCEREGDRYRGVLRE